MPNKQILKSIKSILQVGTTTTCFLDKHKFSLISILYNLNHESFAENSTPKYGVCGRFYTFLMSEKICHLKYLDWSLWYTRLNLIFFCTFRNPWSRSRFAKRSNPLSHSLVFDHLNICLKWYWSPDLYSTCS